MIFTDNDLKELKDALHLRLWISPTDDWIKALVFRLEAAENILNSDYTPRGYINEEMNRWETWHKVAGK